MAACRSIVSSVRMKRIQRLSISFVPPVARFLVGKAVGDVVGTGDRDYCNLVGVRAANGRDPRPESRRQNEEAPETSAGDQVMGVNRFAGVCEGGPHDG
jgi:hypothetical protein